jgi:hypothetical protein
MRQASRGWKVHQPFSQGVQPPLSSQPSARQGSGGPVGQARSGLHFLPSFRTHPKSHLKSAGFWFLAFSFSLAAFLLAWPILDFDIWWHLANGHDILTNLSIPRTENFSHTIFGAPWIDFEWLFQVAAAAIESWGGLRAVTTLKAFLISSALVLTARNTRRLGGTLGLALLGFWSSFFLVRTRAHERPEMVTILFLPLFLFFILKARRSQNSKPLLYYLPFLMLIWVNAHAGFILGLGLLLLVILGQALEEGMSGHRSGLLKSWGLCFLLCGLVTGINPYGFQIYRILLFHVNQGVRVAGLIQEWRVLGLTQYPLFWIFLVSSLGVLVWDIIRRNPEGYFWCPALLAFGYWASGHVRNPGFYPLIVAPYVFGRWGVLQGRFFDWTRSLSAPAACLIVLPLVWAVRKRDFREAANWFFFPRGAADFIEQNNVQGKMYNTYEFGGYLEWRFGHARPVFFDGRYVFIPLLQEESAASSEAGAFARWLDRYQVTYAIVKHTDRMVDHDSLGRPLEVPRSPFALLFPRDRWALVYWDDTALIFLRRIPLNKSVISVHEYKMPDPDDVDLMIQGVRRGFIRKRDLLAELERHTRETGETLMGDILLERVRPLGSP